VTAIIISVVYRKQEFFRVGYYTHNEYQDPALLENPPEELQAEKLVRRILADKPRITRMAITWGDNTQPAV
jgi:histone chaperone ASF1